MDENYDMLWATMLKHILNWPEERIANWIRQFDEERSEPKTLFYHESPSYYVVCEIVPANHIHRLGIKRFNELYSLAEQVLVKLVEAPFYDKGRMALDEGQWAQVENELGNVLARYGISLSELKQP